MISTSLTTALWELHFK